MGEDMKNLFLEKSFTKRNKTKGGYILYTIKRRILRFEK